MKIWIHAVMGKECGYDKDVELEMLIDWDYPFLPRKGENFGLYDFITDNKEVDGRFFDHVLAWDVYWVSWGKEGDNIVPTIFLENEFQQTDG